jgi:transposase
MRWHRSPSGATRCGSVRAAGGEPHSLYAWKKKFATGAPVSKEKDAEIRRLKRELTRVTEERDILKKATAYFARDAK